MCVQHLLLLFISPIHTPIQYIINVICVVFVVVIVVVVVVVVHVVISIIIIIIIIIITVVVNNIVFATFFNLVILFHVANLTDIADKDPHFLVTSSVERNTHLCFDVDGEDGDVLTLVQDPDRSKYTINSVPQQMTHSRPGA